MSLKREDWNNLNNLQTAKGLPVLSAVVNETNECSEYHYVTVVAGLANSTPYCVSIDGRAGSQYHKDIVRKPGVKEPDGPERDWPAIWRRQLREHIERCPMVPREYVDEVLCAVVWFNTWNEAQSKHDTQNT